MDLENLVINVLSNEQYASADKQVNQFYLTPEVIDNTPTENSQNTVTSGGVYSALSNKVDKNFIKEPIHQFEVWANPTCTERPEIGRTYEDLFLQVNKAVGGDEYFTYGNGNNWCSALAVWGYDTEENDGDGYIELYVDYITAASNYNGFPVGVYQVEYPSQAGNPISLDAPFQYSFGEIVGYRETNNFYTKEEVNSKLNLVGQNNIENYVQNIDGYPLLLKHFDDAYNETNTVNFTDKLTFNPQYNELNIRGEIFATYGTIGRLTIMNSGTDNGIISSSINSLEFQGEGFPVLKNTSDNYTITFPNKSGTVALTSDIPTQVQVDWNQTTSTAVDYIKNKPSIPTITWGTANPESAYAQIGSIYITSANEITTMQGAYAAPTWYAMKNYVSNAFQNIFRISSSGIEFGGTSNNYKIVIPQTDSSNNKIQISNSNGTKFSNIVTEEDIEKIKPLILEGDEYYIKKNNNTILPLSNPDLSTQPSILPQRFGKNYLYEVLIPIYDDIEVRNIYGSNTSVIIYNYENSDEFIINSSEENYLILNSGKLILPNSTILESSIIGDGIQDNPSIIRQENINDYMLQPVTLKCLTPGTIEIGGNNGTNRIHYKINNNAWSYEDLNAFGHKSLGNFQTGDIVQFKHNWEGDYIDFGGTAQVEVYGNALFLIDQDWYPNKTLPSGWRLNNLFRYYSSLISAKNLYLPCQFGYDLTQQCYSSMFENCTNLKYTPKKIGNLQKNVPTYGFHQMFKNCTSIEKSPEILSKGFDSYTGANEMFYGCSSLKIVKCNWAINNDSSPHPLQDWLTGVNPYEGVLISGQGEIYNPQNNLYIPSYWGTYKSDNWNNYEKWKIYTHLPFEENLSKMKYLLVRYYNEYYPGYYE